MRFAKIKQPSSLKLSFVNTPRAGSGSFLRRDSSSHTTDRERSSHAAVSGCRRDGAPLSDSAPQHHPHPRPLPRRPHRLRASSQVKLPGVAPRAGDLQDAFCSTSVLCLHQNAQQHLPRLESRELILPGAALHPETKQSLLSGINLSSPSAGSAPPAGRHQHNPRERSPGFRRSPRSPPPAQKAECSCERQQSHSSPSRAVEQKQSLDPTLICSIPG